MKFLFVLIFLPLFSFAQTNEQALLGLWVKVKAQMKDGSRMVDRNGCGMDFLKYNFIKDGSLEYSSGVLFEGYKLPHKLTGDSLIVGGMIYKVLSLNGDTLKLSLFTPFGVEDKQIPVYYFVKTMEHRPNTIATFNAMLKDSVYQVTDKLFPQIKGDLGSLISAVGLSRYDKGTIKASFIVDKKGKVKSTIVLSIDSVSNSFAKTVVNAFGDLSWVPARINNNPINTLVQVTIHSGVGSFPGSVMLKLEYPFIPQPLYAKLDIDDAETERKFFNDAITQANNHNTDKALQLLGQCIEIDNIDLNAYYFRAMLNTSLGKGKEACKDWSILASLGQVTAINNLAKFCKN